MLRAPQLHLQSLAQSVINYAAGVQHSMPLVAAGSQLAAAPHIAAGKGSLIASMHPSGS